MRIRNTLKRVMALFLATVLVCTAVRTTSGAGDLINLNPYRQVFRGKNLNAFGRTHRDMNIYQVGEGAGACRHYAYRKAANFRTEVRRNMSNIMWSRGSRFPSLGRLSVICHGACL